MCLIRLQLLRGLQGRCYRRFRPSCRSGVGLRASGSQPLFLSGEIKIEPCTEVPDSFWYERTKGANGRARFAWYQCSCGRYFHKRSSEKTISCGCYRSLRHRTHGMSETVEYRTWAGIKKRRLNTRCADYPNYGGRGITVCDRWKNSFENFYEDMGPRPHDTTIDRVDFNGNYCPENCRWATQSEQYANRRRSSRCIENLTYNGQSRTVTEWAVHLGWNNDTIIKRLRRGWSVEDTLSKPLGTGRPPKRSDKGN